MARSDGYAQMLLKKVDVMVQSKPVLARQERYMQGQLRKPQANEFLGLIKFFRNEEFMDKLIAGRMHCQTPETYRLSKMEGVSDRAESCVESWRPARGDSAFEVTINDHVLPFEDILALTIHNGEPFESWLHCWFCLRLPEDAEALESLVNDIRRMKKHFGSHYALIVNKDVKPFLRMLQDVSGKTVWAKEVDYTEDVTHWDVSCKSQVYAYQREFRFGFGECRVGETEPYVFDHPDGFAHLIHKSPELIIKNNQDGSMYLDFGAL